MNKIADGAVPQSLPAAPRERSASETFGRVLLVIVLVELLLGGNGYLTEIFGIRLRVWLFIVSMGWVAVMLATPSTKPLPIAIWGLLLMFLVVTGVGTAIGVISGYRDDAIAAELKPLVYFLLILYYALAIRTSDDIELVLKLIVGCAIVQALAYLAVLFLVHSGVVPYATVYHAIKDSDEFIFRTAENIPGEQFFLGFFYKGAFHLCVAALVLSLDPVRRNWWLAVIMLVSIGFTFTRGLWLSMFLLLLYAVFFLPRIFKFVLAVGVSTAAVVLLFATDILALLQRPESDEVRIADLRTIWTELDLRMAIVGMGIGAPIGLRDRIEMTYFEVFYKQGFIGLSLWITLFAVNFFAMTRTRNAFFYRALALHFCAVFVYLQTATNTFLTGSIGMSIVLVSTVSLLVLRDQGSSTTLERRAVT